MCKRKFPENFKNVALVLVLSPQNSHEKNFLLFMSNIKSKECLDPYNFTSIASPVASSNWFAIVAKRKILPVENIDLKIDYFLVNMPSDSVLLT